MDLNNINYNKKELLEIILKNIFLLFDRRNYLKKKPTTKQIEEFIKDGVLNIDDNNQKLSVLYLDTNLKNINIGSVTDEYLNKQIDYRKFVICKSFTKKVYTQINKLYSNCEIFYNYEFLEDIISKVFIPNHKILNQDEKNDLLQKYSLESLSKIYDTDMMSRYYGAKINDIFRIKRHNINSGTSIVYRVVIKGNLDLLF